MQEFFKFVLEVGPVAIFFIANAKFDIFTATAAFMVATIVSLTASKLFLKRIPVMPLVSGVLILLFGGLTLLLKDETFIKLKPTIVNLLFSGALLGSLAFGKLLWKILFGDVFKLTDSGWRILQVRWGFFFLFLAVLNEVVWRNFSTDTWVSFKFFGVMPLTFLFAISQVGIIHQHQIPKPDES